MTWNLKDAYLVSATRAPVAKRHGMFRNVRPDDMLAHVLRASVAQVPQLDPHEIGDVYVGCAIPEGDQGMNLARLGVLMAGLPDSVPAITINRYCSSGLNAVAMAADRIRLGEADVAIGAGVESMSAMPQMFGTSYSANPKWMQDEHVALAYGMGLTAERVADRWKVSGAAQDAFAAASHAKALAAMAAGHFDTEITPYAVTEYLPGADRIVKRVERLCRNDEGPRAGTTPEQLGKLRPEFAAKSSVTAGNASQMSDGAGSVVLMSGAALKRYNVEPLARFVSFAVAGVPPEMMGIGSVEAIPRALKAAGLTLAAIDWFELNEAFAAQALAVMRSLDIDPAKVNPQGGAIALGHPLGATGAIRTATLVHGMRRTGKRYGMVTMCIGTLMGAAGIFEVL
ncbi:acetyl-CoA C-acyltransferase [Aromatoleum petrolei]|uniref:Acetyl-CoA C-acyltransferase n=1 Tax=Aromatoleum petrolei TaxID=76116 RepID=A0ABX1MXT3_9RHOO|nr:acetyl-CoA C-acyltransferase [Aromatoleum petrolei]NMF91471.1 acetyl-CoA C-acyltransferase [Aromatoleum petrolei]QTQ34543.1 Acetyl-CoA acetyltransferase [Aromatoleum petrolei]